MTHNPANTNGFLTREGNLLLAINTLKELGILKDDNDTPKVQHFHS